LQLLRLRQISFGPDLQGCLPCAVCGARLEFTLNLPRMIDHLEAEAAKVGSISTATRQASLCDLRAVMGEEDPHEARRALLEHCLRNGDVGEEFASEEEALDAFTQLHRGAELVGQATCAECGQSQEFDFDIARFLWAEVRNRALGLLREVHELATAYGWFEAEILRMTPQRRQAYLEMART
jgi:hypothetical protein